MTFSTAASASLLDLSNLPTLPQTLIELIEACNNSDIDIYALGELVARDATISARILQLANSAFLGTKAAFSEIEQAVIYLGIDTVRNLAVSVSVHEAFSSGKNTTGINMPQFWYHSLLTAILAKTLAEAADYASPAEAYLAGLLHDLGKLLLALSFPETYAALLLQQPPSDHLIERERHDLGTDHAEASCLLVRHWNLQEIIAEAIEMHHDSTTAENAQLSLGNIIYLANRLSRISPDSHNFTNSTSLGCLTSDTIEKCYRQATTTVEEIAQAMGITVACAPESNSPSQQDSATMELQAKVGSLTKIFGTLDNLLKAEDHNRICQVMEESLQILFGIRHSFLILPSVSSGSSRVAMSSNNPLYPHIADIPLQEEVDVFSIVGKCCKNGCICHISKPDTTSHITGADSNLITFLGCEALLAIPVPLSDMTMGILIAGLPDDKLRRLLPAIDSLRLFADHCGARLQLEHIRQRRLADIARKEIETLENIARSIAHEISNPLAIIQNYLTLIERKIAEKIDTTHDIQLISGEIERISTISRQLENISSITSTQPIKTTRLDHLLKDILTYFRQSIFLHRKIEISIRLQPYTRSLPVPLDTLRQVLTILFTNAAESLPDGGQIIVSSLLEQTTQGITRDVLRLSVSDNGPGVEPAMTGSIFNAGITTKKIGHLGLGLSIARKLLIDRGGNIRYEPSPGGGACFIIMIPVSQ